MGRAKPSGTRTTGPTTDGPQPDGVPSNVAASVAGLEVRRVPLSALHKDPANVRLHGDKNLSAIVASLKEFGQVEPLVVQRSTGKVIGGNGRVEAMIAMGWTHADVVELDIDHVKATALGIALNRTASLGEWDDNALANVLKSLKDDDFDIEATGYMPDEVDAMIAAIDDQSLPDGANGKEYDESVEDEVEYIECPECHHKWPK